MTQPEIEWKDFEAGQCLLFSRKRGGYPFVQVNVWEPGSGFIHLNPPGMQYHVTEKEVKVQIDTGGVLVFNENGTSRWIKKGQVAVLIRPTADCEVLTVPEGEGHEHLGRS